MQAITLLALIGLAISIYVVWVQQHLSRKDYKPWCDISKRVSCSKAFKSKYSTLLSFHNGVVGVLFYLLIFFFWSTGIILIVQIMVFLGLLATILLAWLSYVRMKNFCIVCTAVYLVNILLLLSVL